MKTIPRWKDFDLGRAANLRKRTVAWHVNNAMNQEAQPTGLVFLNGMMEDNIIKQKGEQYVLIRYTPARVRDVKRMPIMIGICIQMLAREHSGIAGDGSGFNSELEDSWKNFDKLIGVRDALNSIVVI